MKFGLATPSILWDLGLIDRKAMAKEVFDAGFDHMFLADHVSFHDGSGADGFVGCGHGSTPRRARGHDKYLPVAITPSVAGGQATIQHGESSARPVYVWGWRRW